MANTRRDRFPRPDDHLQEVVRLRHGQTTRLMRAGVPKNFRYIKGKLRKRTNWELTKLRAL
jgi:hypothetical protein